MSTPKVAFESGKVPFQPKYWKVHFVVTCGLLNVICLIDWKLCKNKDKISLRSVLYWRHQASHWKSRGCSVTDCCPHAYYDGKFAFP